MKTAAVRTRSAFGSLQVPTNRTFTSRSRHLTIRTMAANAPVYDIAVKGVPDPKTGNLILGDCPFSHRALLTLEEKKIPYTKTLIDFDHKPQWLLDVNPSGGVPVLKDLSTGDYIPDSGAIADLLETKHADAGPKLGTAETAPQVGANLFGAFVQFFKCSAEEAKEKEENLLKELKELNDHLSKNGPFVGGNEVCATDLSLAPKLYHLKEALKHYKNWDIPAEFSAVKEYFDKFTQRESWKNTYYSPELIVKGWAKHVQK